MAIGDKLKAAFVGKREACEACGTSFECGRLLGGLCWCAKEKISTTTLERLEREYRRCLCQDCLRRAERESSPAGEPQKL